MEDIQPQVVYPSTIWFLYIPGQVVCNITIFWNKKPLLVTYLVSLAVNHFGAWGLFQKIPS